MTQAEFPPIVEFAEDAQRAAIQRYMADHVTEYRGMARAISPDLKDWRSVWERFTFAILSANTQVSSAVTALDRARQHMGLPTSMLKGLNITPDRAMFVNRLPLGDEIFKLLKLPREGWHQYRLRIRESVDGLAITKASYAACLLYPLAAEVACLDTWMLTAFGVSRRHFKSINDAEYIRVEAKLAEIALPARVNLALAQWMAWDWVRHRGPEHQRFFVW